MSGAHEVTLFNLLSAKLTSLHTSASVSRWIVAVKKCSLEERLLALTPHFSVAQFQDMMVSVQLASPWRRLTHKHHQVVNNVVYIVGSV